MSPSGDNQMPSSTERILCQSLNDVSSQSSASYSGNDVNLKKIAKKRRGSGGTVDVEYTKSSKEYLQKAQQSLRRESVKNSFAGFSAFSSSSNPGSRANQSVQTTGQSSSNPYGYEDPDMTPLKFKGPAHRSLSQPAISSSGNPYGHGDPAASNPYGYGDAPPANKYGSGDPAASNPYGYGDAAPSSNPYGYGDAAPSSNPYGYENPDAAPTIRRRGTARRRGSVTKFSVQAAAAASAVTDRILKKTNLLSRKDGGEVLSKPMRTQRRSTCSNVPSSSCRFKRMSMDNGRSQDAPSSKIFDRPSSGDMKLVKPKRQASFGDPLEIEEHSQQDIADNASKPSEINNPMAVDIVSTPQRGRPRRRRATLKVSVEPQSHAMEAEQVGLLQSESNFQPTPSSSLGPEMETSLNDEKKGPESRWSLLAPDQSVGRSAPERSSSNHSFKRQFMSPKRSGSLHSLSRAAMNLRKDNPETALHDSIGSGLSWDDGSMQAPIQKYHQSPNWRGNRKYPRSNSVGSLGSACDSLASDMESLCSISVRTDDKPVLSPVASFKKCIVSRTPSKLSRHNSNGSLFGSKPKDNSNDDGSVAALKALNLDKTAKQQYGVSRKGNPNALGRSYSGDRLRVLRDQKLVRDQH